MNGEGARAYKPIVDIPWPTNLTTSAPTPLSDWLPGSEFGTADPQLRDEAREHLIRAAAFETGAIEGLYASKQGATVTIAQQSEGWESILEDAGADAPDRFNDQLSAYERAIEIAAERGGQILEADIRELHALATASQATYVTLDQFGTTQHKDLKPGAYKDEQNFTRDRLGRLKSYAPTSDVGPEIQQALATYREILDQNSPYLASAFIHWAIAHIHPFADGNGRTARVIASIPLLAATGLPYVLFADRKQSYYQDLDRADGGETDAFLAHSNQRADAGTELFRHFIAELADDTQFQLEESARILASQADSAESIEDAGKRVAAELLTNVVSEVALLPQAPAIEIQASQRPQADDLGFFGNPGTTVGVGQITAKTVGPIRVATQLTWRVAAREDWIIRVEVSIRSDGYPDGIDKNIRYEDAAGDISTEASLVLSGLGHEYVRIVTTQLRLKIQAAAGASGNLPPSED